jgi:hypothetical protein
VGVVLIVLLYYVVKLWKAIEGWAEGFYDKYLKNFKLADLIPLVEKGWHFITGSDDDCLWPMLKKWALSVWNTISGAWDKYATPVISFVKDQLERPDSAFHKIVNQVNMLVGYWEAGYKWLVDKISFAIDTWGKWWDKLEAFFIFMKLDIADEHLSIAARNDAFGGMGVIPGQNDWQKQARIADANAKVQAVKIGKIMVDYVTAQLLNELPGNKDLFKLSKSNYVEVETRAHAKGGIITKPEISQIGEEGPEAVIPLNEQGASFLRKAFFNDFASMISPKDLDTIREVPQNVLDIEAMEKMIQDTIDDGMKKKFEMVLALLKKIDEKKQDPLQSTGGSSKDEYADLIRAISTGVLGVR